MKIAVIGAGIAGLGAAWALSRGHAVTLLEAEGRPGGHAHTQDISVAGKPVSVDTGFIVYNTLNYPHLNRLFEHLAVPNMESDMSFAVSLDDGGWEMAGRPLGLFGSPGQLVSRSHWALLANAVRFFRQAEAVLDDPATDSEALGPWLARHGYHEHFVRRFLAPMAGAIWSSSLNDIMDYPVRSFVAFFRNHQLLKFSGRVRWRTVSGGSANYVSRLLDDFDGGLHLSAPVAAVRVEAGRPCVELANGYSVSYDAVVMATHGDQSARLLAGDPDRERSSVLGAFRYQPNEAWLHRDPALMPRRQRLWSSWNYLGSRTGEGDRRIAVSYWMNRLQELDTTQDILVTLNPPRAPRDELVFARMTYDHPQFDLGALRARESLGGLQGRDGLWFCGSYTGNGFHEDGLRSGLQVAAALGSPAPWWSAADDRLAPWIAAPAPPAKAA
ncbi:MAG: FAD-dependent oxidoreductase [Rhodospirillales bacterium]|nr:FAD-dependent oxidoreductase [Rhodospirillales bacterium]